jgi:hypothetical protein
MLSSALKKQEFGKVTPRAKDFQLDQLRSQNKGRLAHNKRKHKEKP